MHQLIHGWIPFVVEDMILLAPEPPRLVYVEVTPKTPRSMAAKLGLNAFLNMWAGRGVLIAGKKKTQNDQCN